MNDDVERWNAALASAEARRSLPRLERLLPTGNLLLCNVGTRHGVSADAKYVHPSELMRVRGLGIEFDAAFCAEDSLASLTETNEMEAALDEIYQVLKPGGLLLAAGPNDDRRWRDKPRRSPLRSGRTETEDVLLLEFIDYYGGYLDLHETYLVRPRPDGAWREYARTHRRRPVFRKDLRNALQLIGFREIEIWGSWEADPFHPLTSELLIMSGRK